MNRILEATGARLGGMLRARGAMLATAESCTGGMVSAVVTATAGSSEWFERGFVTYSNEAKVELLGVPRALIEQHGAVSEAVVRSMAEGALAHARADFALAITGIAGPGGGVPGKPVGTVWLGWAGTGRPTVARQAVFPGDRGRVREAAAQSALEGLIEYLDREARE